MSDSSEPTPAADALPAALPKKARKTTRRKKTDATDSPHPAAATDAAGGPPDRDVGPHVPPAGGRELAEDPGVGGAADAPAPLPPDALPLPVVPAETPPADPAPADEVRGQPERAPRLSVVFGTLNRLPYLQKALASIAASAGDLAYEIVVVDGGSTDGTLEYLRGRRAPGLARTPAASTLRVIEQGEPLGAVRAFNAGFAAARGEYVANFNDDAEYVGDTLVRAVRYLDAHSTCGQVAIPFGVPGATPETQIIPNWLAQNIHRKNLAYANFGVVRRELGARCGWWGTELRQYGGDTRLSVEVWIAGYTVDVLAGAAIVHHAVEDGTRVPNVETHLLAQHYGAPSRKVWNAERRDAGRGGSPERPGLVRLRYRGLFVCPALFTDNPSGKVYKVKLTPGALLYVDARDRQHFLNKRDEEHGALFEEDAPWRKSALPG